MVLNTTVENPEQAGMRERNLIFERAGRAERIVLRVGPAV